MISPRDVVEEMSFARNARAPPPSSAPPPPPPEPEDKDESDPLLLGASYQHNEVPLNGGGGRAANAPTIRHYDEEEGGDPRSLFRYGFGDSTIRPNIGQDNAYDHAIFGLALHELLEYLRMTNIAAAITADLLLLSTWLWKFVTLHWPQLVLSVFLATLSTMLLLTELMSLHKIQRIDSFLRDNFGILYSPVGKSVYLYFLATLCWGMIGLFEMLLGWVYFLSATVLLAAYMMYPELRRPQQDITESLPREAPRAHSWSAYSTSFSSFMAASSEKTSLLQKAFQTRQSSPV